MIWLSLILFSRLLFLLPLIQRLVIIGKDGTEVNETPESFVITLNRARIFLKISVVEIENCSADSEA